MNYIRSFTLKITLDAITAPPEATARSTRASATWRVRPASSVGWPASVVLRSQTRVYVVQL